MSWVVMLAALALQAATLVSLHRAHRSLSRLFLLLEERQRTESGSVEDVLMQRLSSELGRKYAPPGGHNLITR